MEARIQATNTHFIVVGRDPETMLNFGATAKARSSTYSGTAQVLILKWPHQTQSRVCRNLHFLNHESHDTKINRSASSEQIYMFDGVVQAG